MTTRANGFERVGLPLDGTCRALLVGSGRALYPARWVRIAHTGTDRGHRIGAARIQGARSMDEVGADYRRHAGALLDQLTMRPAL